MTTVTGGPKGRAPVTPQPVKIEAKNSIEATPAAATGLADADRVDATTRLPVTAPTEAPIPTAESDLPKVAKLFSDLAARVGARPATTPAEPFAVDAKIQTESSQPYSRSTEQATFVVVATATAGTIDIPADAEARLEARLAAWSLPLHGSDAANELARKLLPTTRALYHAVSSVVTQQPTPAPVLRLRRALDAASINKATLADGDQKTLKKALRLALVSDAKEEANEGDLEQALGSLPPVTIPAPALVACEQGLRQAVGGIDLGSADIEAAVSIVLFECERSANDDLKEALAEMKAINEKKKAQRQFISYLKRQEAAARSALKAEYDRRVAIAAPDPMHIDSDKVSFDAFCDSQMLSQKSGELAPGSGDSPPDTAHAPTFGVSPNKPLFAYDVADAKGRTLSLKELGQAEKLGLSREDFCDLKEVWGADGELRARYGSMSAWLVNGVGLSVPPTGAPTKLAADYVAKWKAAQAQKANAPATNNGGELGLSQRFPGLGDEVAAWLEKVFNAMGSPGGDLVAYLKNAPPDGVGLHENGDPTMNEAAYNAFVAWLPKHAPITFTDGKTPKSAKQLMEDMIGYTPPKSLSRNETTPQDDAFAKYLASAKLPNPPGKDAIDAELRRFLRVYAAESKGISSGQQGFGEISPAAWLDDPAIKQYIGVVIASTIKDLNWSTAQDKGDPPFRGSIFFSADVYNDNHIKGTRDGDFQWWNKSNMQTMATGLKNQLEKMFGVGFAEADASPGADAAKLAELLQAAPSASGPVLLSGGGQQGGGAPPEGDMGLLSVNAVAFNATGFTLAGASSISVLDAAPPPPDHYDGLRELSLKRLGVEIEDWQGRMDSTSELSEEKSMRLQMIMDRRKKFLETLSNVMKKIADTSATITQNLK